MKTIFILFCITLLLLGFSSCKKNPTEPGDNNNSPGRRDYVWNVDTLKYHSLLSKISGASANDVYAIGIGDWAYNLWHYDGTTWSPISKSLDGRPMSILALAKNNIWFGTDYSSIYNYDGTNWNNKIHLIDDIYSKIVLNSLAVDNLMNIYCVGTFTKSNPTLYSGCLYKYDGIKWWTLVSGVNSVSFETVRYENDSGLIFIQGANYDSSGWTGKVYVYNGSDLKEILSNNNESSISCLQNDVIITNHYMLYKYKNGNLTFWKDFSGNGFIGEIWGRNENDFFFSNYRGVMHYNGTDVKVLLPLNVYIISGVIFEKEVFSLGYSTDNNQDLLIHGKLPDLGGNKAQ